MSNTAIRLQPCRPVEDDGRLVYAWRTDPETQAMFFTRMDLDWDAFWPVWRDGYFSDPELTPAFAMNGEGVALGIISFQRIEPLQDFGACVDISINVAPEARGQGIGAAALSEVQGYLKDRKVDTVVAVVKADNAASAVSFEKAGFRFFDDAVHTVTQSGETVRVKRYVLSLGG